MPMQVNVEFDDREELLTNLNLTEDQLADAISNALRNMAHPETGEPLYINAGMRVTVAS